MAAAERAGTRAQRVVFWRLWQPKTHMNITAVTSADMLHAADSRNRRGQCQRRLSRQDDLPQRPEVGWRRNPTGTDHTGIRRRRSSASSGVGDPAADIGPAKTAHRLCGRQLRLQLLRAPDRTGPEASSTAEPGAQLESDRNRPAHQFGSLPQPSVIVPYYRD